MSEPVCDQKRLASHFYQKTCMGVAEIVYPDFFNS